MTVTSVTKSQIIRNIWRNFYDRLKDNVTSITLADSSTSTIQTYSSQYSDSTFDTKSDYPILIVNSPSISSEQYTLTKTKIEGTIEIDIFATNAQAADRFLDAINESLETYRDDLRGGGLQFVELDGTEIDMFERGKMKIHVRTARWRFSFVHTKTTAY